MENRIANSISYLVHPLIMPVFGLLIITHSGTYVADLDLSLLKIIYLSVVILTFIIPVALVPVYSYLKLVNNIQLSERNERIVPFFITFIFYFLAYYLISKLPVSQVYWQFMLAACSSVLLVVIISYFWKISAHLTGLGGLTALILSLSLHFGSDLMLYLIAVIIITGLAGYARLKLNAHTPMQVYTGFLVGFIPMIVVFFFKF